MVVLPGLDRELRRRIPGTRSRRIRRIRSICWRGCCARSGSRPTTFAIGEPAAATGRAASAAPRLEALRPAGSTHRWRDLRADEEARAARVAAARLRRPAGRGGDDRAAAARGAGNPGRDRGARHARPRSRAPRRRRVAALGHRDRRFRRRAAEPTPPGVFLRLVLDAGRRAHWRRCRCWRLLKHPLAARRARARAEFRDAGAPARARNAARAAARRRASPVCARPLSGKAPALRRFVDAPRDLPRRRSPRLARAPRRRASATWSPRISRPPNALARERRESRRGAALARAGGRGRRRVLPRAARRGARFPAACAAATIRRCSKRCSSGAGGAAALRPTSAALAIWGLLEARLQQADLVVLGGLNEGTWPAADRERPVDVAADAARTSACRRPSGAIGIAAHDFAQALGAPRGRADPRDAASRARRPCRRAGCCGSTRCCARSGSRAGSAPIRRSLRPQRSLDRPQTRRPMPRAAPRPPLAARPRKLSVTAIETWRRDPYAIYARHVLRLRALDPLDADPGARRSRHLHPRGARPSSSRRFPRHLPADARDRAAGDRRAPLRRGCSTRPGVCAPSGGRASSASRAGSSPRSASRRARPRRDAQPRSRARSSLRRRAGRSTIIAIADRIERAEATASSRSSTTRPARCPIRPRSRQGDRAATAARRRRSPTPAASRIAAGPVAAA